MIARAVAEGEEKPVEALAVRKVHVPHSVELLPMDNGMLVEIETREHYRLEVGS